MNKRLILAILLSFGLIAALAVYVISDRHRVYRLTIAAGSKQGESYTFIQQMAKIVAQYQPKIQIQVLETKGSEENIELLEQNKAQLALAQADIPTLPSARMVSFLFPDIFQLVVTEKSGIQQVSGLRGKRIGLPPAGGGQYKSFWLLAAHYRLASTEFSYKAISEQEADAAFRNNQVDAVFRVRPPGNKSILELVQNSRGRLVAIDQAAAMKIKQPTFEATFIPKGAYQGDPPIPALDLPTVAVQRTLLANKGVDAQIIQEITRILYEHRQELGTAMPLASYISPPNAVGGTGLPIHPGAQAYYDREKPSFAQENADYLGLLLTLALLLGSWVWGFKTRFEKKRKNKTDSYNQDIIVLIIEIYSSNNLQRLREIRQQLINILKDVVNALDRDQITPESFQSFTFTWEIAIAAVRDRENILIAEQTATP